MRIPERCPWCGAGKSSKQRGLYECGADFCSHCGEWLVTCADSDTPAAKAYRETLAWRKRLSQHTGVPLRLVPEPEYTSAPHFVRWFAGKHMVILGSDGLDVSRVSGDGRPRHTSRYWIRTEARRRLLAEGE